MSVWGDTYNRALNRGEDHGSAAFIADQAEERAMRKQKQATVTISGVMIRREGDYVVCEIEYRKAWVEIARERLDGDFSHIINPSAMLAAGEAKPHD